MRTTPTWWARLRISRLSDSIKQLKCAMPSSRARVCERICEAAADTAALPVVHYRDCELRCVRLLLGADVAGNAHACLGAKVDRHERLVVVMVDLGQVPQLMGAELPVWR